MSKEQILSSDGIPLEVSLKKAEKKNKLKAVLLVAPLFLFILIVYIFPIGDMLFRSIDDRMITKMLPKTFNAIEKWDGKDLPDEDVYKGLFEDLTYLKKNKTYGKIIARLNYEKSGFSSLIKKTVRKISKFEEGNYKEQFIKVHKRWGQSDYLVALKNVAPNWTYAKYLKGIDRKFDQDGNIIQVPEDRRIHKTLWLRTLNVAFWVTLFCFILAYPISHLLATLPMKYSNLLMICVLLPFWTSLLVRTSSWMVLLQQQGPINDLIVWLGLAADDNRPELMYNVIGTFVAMTQILLPFMVLPLYSVMKTISPSLMRAGKSLGGTPLTSFVKIYFPLTIPGIGAGCLLVFILAIGYYITPALVGGASGSLISNTIAYHMKSSLDWAFASALGTMLLVGVLTIYWIYNKLVGIDNIKLG
ncbi:ABC transporter permease [Candidatus Pelagibacter sp.]|jgi:putative spermidine/putrescine transport system permease protein|nr:ABC transporter permease [Candidatus Pelagibacter sp.]MDC1177988.1 ABC transporter permease [Candidatus Pelagibacter sp.]